MSIAAVSPPPAASAGAEKWTALRILVVALCFMLNMLDGADLLIVSFIAPVLADQWNVSPEALGALFSASLAGMAIGCLFIAPLADRVGRRPVLIGALAAVAGAMMVSGLCSTIEQLMAARLLVGIGVGAIGVSMSAMAAEYAPPAYSGFAVGLVQAGWPFGSIVTAIAAAALLPDHGWEILVIGIGAISAALLLLLFFALPESLAYLACRQPRRALARINAVRPRLGLAPMDALPAMDRDQPPRASPAALFRDGRARASILLWTAVTLGYFVLYFVISWIPKLAVEAGLPLADAIYAGGTYNLGAFLGTSAMGWFAVRHRLPRVIALFYALASVAMLIFGGVGMGVAATLAVAFCIGVTVQGGFNGYWALAAQLYPAEMRGTGIGWALGVGRIGAVLGPLAGGFLVGANVALPYIFAIYVIPLTGAILLMLRLDSIRETGRISTAERAADAATGVAGPAYSKP